MKKQHRKHRAVTHGFAGELVSDARLVAAVMTRCAWCGHNVPTARLAQHERVDHIAKKHPRPPEHFCPEIPGHFKHVLDVLGELTERTYGQMITAALDDWLPPRAPVGFRQRSWPGTENE